MNLEKHQESIKLQNIRFQCTTSLTALLVSFIPVLVALLISYFRVEFVAFYRTKLQYLGLQWFCLVTTIQIIPVSVIFPQIGRQIRYFFLVILLFNDFIAVSEIFVSYEFLVSIKTMNICIFSTFTQFLGHSISCFLQFKEKYMTYVGLYIGFLFNIVAMICLDRSERFVLGDQLPFLLGLLWGFLLSLYLNYDMHFMLNKRCSEYNHSDWYFGMVNLYTDIYFVFWRDIFSNQKMEDLILEDLSIERKERSLVFIL